MLVQLVPFLFFTPPPLNHPKSVTVHMVNVRKILYFWLTWL